MLKIDQITVLVESKKLINNISLEIDKAHVVGIVGANGAGKTTLLRAISELVEHTGSVSYQGIPLVELSALKRTEVISYCGSADEILTEMKSRDVLEYSRYGKDQNNELKHRAIELFELSELMDRTVSSLSGGERQRLNLACSLYQDSKVMLWDEPTNYLDPKHVDLLEEIVKEQTKNKLLIVVSHDINFLLDIADEIVGLKNAELSFVSNTRDVFENKLLDDIFDKNFLYISECNKLVVR